MKSTSVLLLIFLMSLCSPSIEAEPLAQWENIFDGGGNVDTGISAMCCSDGHLIAGGTSSDQDSNISTHIRKLDSTTGEEIWSNGYLATAGNTMSFGGFFEDNAGNILVGAYILICGS